MAHHHTGSAPAVTYTPAGRPSGHTLTCRRCARVYAYPAAGGSPVRCECGWWYTNTGASRLVEEFRPRIGGAATSGPEKAADLCTP